MFTKINQIYNQIKSSFTNNKKIKNLDIYIEFTNNKLDKLDKLNNKNKKIDNKKCNLLLTKKNVIYY